MVKLLSTKSCVSWRVFAFFMVLEQPPGHKTTDKSLDKNSPMIIFRLNPKLIFMA